MHLQSQSSPSSLVLETRQPSRRDVVLSRAAHSPILIHAVGRRDDGGDDMTVKATDMLGNELTALQKNWYKQSIIDKRKLTSSNTLTHGDQMTRQRQTIAA